MTITRGTFSDAYVEGLWAMFTDSYTTKRADSAWKNMCTVKTTKKVIKNHNLFFTNIWEITFKVISPFLEFEFKFFPLKNKFLVFFCNYLKY